AYEIKQGLLGLVNAVTVSSSLSSISMDPAGRFLYATSVAANAVTTFKINPSSGALSQASISPSEGKDPRAVSLTYPNERFVWAEQPEPLFSYRIDADAGSLSLTGSVAARREVAADPTNRFLFALKPSTSGIAPVILSYRVNNQTGSLTQTAS